MDNINSYIDICLIKDYGTPNHDLNAFELDIDDVPKHEITSLLDRLMAEDTNVRDYVLSEMQRLINNRLREVTLNA